MDLDVIIMDLRSVLHTSYFILYFIPQQHYLWEHAHGIFWNTHSLSGLVKKILASMGIEPRSLGNQLVPTELSPSTTYCRMKFHNPYCHLLSLPLWFSGQSSWLQIQRSGFVFWRYHIFQVVGLKRDPLSLVSTTEELPERKSSGSSLEIEITAVGIRHAD
jgi:hypothetical protein